MEKALTIKEVVEKLNISEPTVRAHLKEWGFFKMKGSRIWRVYKSDLDRNREKENNISRLEVRIGDKENKCRSIKNKMVSGGLISERQAVKELDTLLERLIKNQRKSTTTNLSTNHGRSKS